MRAKLLTLPLATLTLLVHLPAYPAFCADRSQDKTNVEGMSINAVKGVKAAIMYYLNQKGGLSIPFSKYGGKDALVGAPYKTGQKETLYRGMVGALFPRGVSGPPLYRALDEVFGWAAPADYLEVRCRHDNGRCDSGYIRFISMSFWWPEVRR